MKIPYPRYSRAQNLNCKLTDRQIKQIPILFRKGRSKSFIARKFKVTRAAVRYWLASPRKRKLIAKKRYASYPAAKYYTTEQIREMNRARNARKKKIMGKAVNKYYHQPSISWIERQKNKKEIKNKYYKKYLSKPENKKKRLAYLKRYWSDPVNRKKKKETDRKYRLRIKAEKQIKYRLNKKAKPAKNNT